MLNMLKMAIEVMILDPVFYLEMPKYISYAKEETQEASLVTLID